MSFRALWTDLRYMHKYWIAALAVFVAGFVLGSDTSGSYGDFIRGQMKGMEQLAGLIRSQSHPQLWLFIFIYLNNLLKSLMFVFFGMLAAVPPIALLLINGMVLGFVTQQAAAEQTWLFVAKGILPHGIIEIPAIILACAYGIRLGFIVVKSPLALVIPGWRSRIRNEWTHVMKLTIPLAGLLAIALAIAALIESTLTYWLVQS